MRELRRHAGGEQSDAQRGDDRPAQPYREQTAVPQACAYRTVSRQR